MPESSCTPRGAVVCSAEVGARGRPAAPLPLPRAREEATLGARVEVTGVDEEGEQPAGQERAEASPPSWRRRAVRDRRQPGPWGAREARPPRLTWTLIGINGAEVGASLLSLAWHPEIISAGASGALFGLAGALFTHLRARRDQLPPRVYRSGLRSLLYLIGINLAFGALVPGIDNAAHVGGLLVGLAVGWSLARGGSAEPAARALPRGRLAGIGVVLLALVPVILHRTRGAGSAGSWIHMMRGHLAEEEDDVARAIEEYTRAIELDAENDEAYGFRGQARYFAGRTEEALEDLERALAIDPGDQADLFNRALCHAELGNSAAAIADYTAVLDHDPENDHALYNRGLLRAGEGDHEGAVQDFSSSLELAPEDPQSLGQRAISLVALERWDEARPDLERVIALEDGASPYLRYHAYLLVRTGEYAESRRVWDRVIAHEPDDGYARYHRAHLNYALGDTAASLDDFRAVRQHLPDMTDESIVYEWILRRRIRGSPSLDEELRAHFAEPGEGGDGDPESSYADIARLLLGEVAPEQLLDGLDPDEEGDLLKIEFFTGTRALLEGDRTEARAWFERVVAREEGGHYEYVSALEELRRLDDSR